MTKIKIFTSHSILGDFYNVEDKTTTGMDFECFELSLSEDDDGIDFFMNHPDKDNNGTFIYTVLSADEADILADNLHKMAEMFRKASAQEQTNI